MDLFEDKLLTKPARANHRLIGQLFDTYWLVEYHDNLYIIDQHAAHEKILYERTMASLQKREYTSQMIDPPIILSLNSSEQLKLEQYMEHFVQFEDVSKYYQTGSVRIAAADHLNFYVDKGEFCIIVGPSGAGKTTLLNILGGMDTCDEGHVWLDGQDVSHFSEKELTTYRRYDVGFVFQFYNLVQNLTALENVELASEICRDPLDPAATLESVGLGERLNNFPAQLSGGEQQRVSIARALAKNPKLLLCDEPTGALDYKTGKQVLALLQRTCRETGRTVIVITHNTALTAMADRIIQVKSGQILSNKVNEHPVPVEQIEW